MATQFQTSHPEVTTFRAEVAISSYGFSSEVRNCFLKATLKNERIFSQVLLAAFAVRDLFGLISSVGEAKLSKYTIPLGGMGLP